MSTVIDEPLELPTPAPKKKRTRRQIIEWSIVIGAAFLTAIVLRIGVVQAFSIPSVSMEDTLLVGDRVLVNKLSTSGHTPHRGDIVVFKRPPGEEAAAIKDLIKRVIGLPGDTVSAEDGELYVNGKRVNEPYLNSGTRTVMDHPTTVPNGRVFVMGDNRTQSRDSRFFGPITIKSIIGRAVFRVWPPNRLGRL